MSPQKTKNPLQQRVNDFLHGNPLGYVVVESGQQSVEDLSILLQRAEEDLNASQARVDRLKWEMEKARS